MSDNENQASLRKKLKLGEAADFAQRFILEEQADISDEAAELALLELVFDLFEEESGDEEQPRPWGGSQPGKAPNKDRGFEEAEAALKKDYFNGGESVYTEEDFERRFRMPRSVFNTIYNAADETFRLSETVANNALKEFASLVVQEFGDQYLNRPPTAQEKRRILEINDLRCLPGCFASWDCKHFSWDNCPVGLAGQHRGRADGGKKTLILEAIADPDLYIWDSHFGEPGTLNDLNVLDKSSIVGAILDGSLDVRVEPYKINGKQRDWMYFLVDGIYPNWAIFVQTYGIPEEEAKKLFNMVQEFGRKDVERAFGVLVKKFQILKQRLRLWYLLDIKNILNCCIIFHNMVVESRRDLFAESRAELVTRSQLDQAIGNDDAPQNVTLFSFEEEEVNFEVTTLLGHRVSEMEERLLDADAHQELRRDLTAHVFRLMGGGEHGMEGVEDNGDGEDN